MQIGGHRERMLMQRLQATNGVRSHGTQRIPAQLRGVTTQQGEGGVLVTWHLPKRYEDVTGYRIYLGTEKNLSVQIKDRGTRQIFIPLEAGASPPLNNIFVSAVNGFREGPRVQIQQASTANASLPNPKPSPAPDFLNLFSGGLDKTQSGQPTGKKTP
jgi:hypothetical protein